MTKPSADQLKELIAEITGKEPSVISGETKFKDDLAMDSIALADLLASLEEDHDIIVEQEDALQLQSFSQLEDYISKL